jgi:type IV pilus assembly protein PilA
MMKGFMKGKKGEKGFTLVELLIVFTLLGVLAAIMIPNVASLVGYGNTQAEEAELSVVQTAMDAMMAKDNLSAVSEVSSATDNMSAFPSTDHALFPEYLRDGYTAETYTCNTSGFVSQTAR